MEAASTGLLWPIKIINVDGDSQGFTEVWIAAPQIRKPMKFRPTRTSSNMKLQKTVSAGVKLLFTLTQMAVAGELAECEPNRPEVDTDQRSSEVERMVEGLRKLGEPQFFSLEHIILLVAT